MWLRLTIYSHGLACYAGGSTLADLQQALEDYLPVLLGLVYNGINNKLFALRSGNSIYIGWYTAPKNANDALCCVHWNTSEF